LAGWAFAVGWPISDRIVAIPQRRIIQFLLTSGATRPADLPDWLLATLEGDDSEERSHELITAATLIYVRRQHPGSASAPLRP